MAAIILSAASLIGCAFIIRSQRRMSRELDRWEAELDAGAEDRTRTGMSPQDFESRASTSSATPAEGEANP